MSTIWITWERVALETKNISLPYIVTVCPLDD